VEKPEDWACSSFRHYATGEEGVVEIESEWTGSKRERMGMPLRLKVTGNRIMFDAVSVGGRSFPLAGEG
jgi:hypothetical protein